MVLTQWIDFEESRYPWPLYYFIQDEGNIL